jgi:hypothetical protein
MSAAPECGGTRSAAAGHLRTSAGGSVAPGAASRELRGFDRLANPCWHELTKQLISFPRFLANTSWTKVTNKPIEPMAQIRPLLRWIDGEAPLSLDATSAAHRPWAPTLNSFGHSGLSGHAFLK